MRTNLFLSIIFIFTLVGCNTVRVITDHDYSYETNFKKFKTYNFVSCENDTTEICQEIQATIKKQMEIRGYKFDADQADLYIGYMVMTNKVKYKAYNQPAISRWIEKYDTDDNYKTEKLNFHDGMVIVSIIEAKNNSLIWRGFSTDISNKKKENYNMNYFYSNVIRDIFKEYTLFASNR